MTTARPTTTSARLEQGSLRVDFDLSGGQIALTLAERGDDTWRTLTTEQPRFFALSAESAQPVTLIPGWFPGEEITNFATFHTNHAPETRDIFQAGPRRDLPLTELSQISSDEVQTRTADGALVVSWQLRGRQLAMRSTFTAPASGYWSIGCAPVAAMPDDAVRGLIAGPFLTECRLPIVAGVLPEGWLALPGALVETETDGAPRTDSLLADPDQGNWGWKEVGEARYAIGARNAGGQIQIQGFAPVLGNSDSHLSEGQTTGWSWLLTVGEQDWWSHYRYLLDDVYHLESYRENVYGSLTDAVHNLVDLLKDPYFSGWSERGRGLLNIEHRDGVKLASPGAALSAGLIAADRDLLTERALPILEYSLSRSHYGFTWSFGSETVGQEHVRQAFEDLGGPAWDTPVLVALHQLARGYTPALAIRAEERAEGITDFYIRRSDFQVSLSRYVLTGEELFLEQARAEADRYIAERIDTPATDAVEGQRFLIHIGADWMSLLDLWEVTQEPRYLDAAERAARWFATLFWVERIDKREEVTVPADRIAERVARFDDRMTGTHWALDAVQYPRKADEIPAERVPQWITSPVGMSFEAWCTYWGRMVQNPGWAAYFLRLARATGDDFFRVLAENNITGRFTNYPGYYYYLPTISPLQPDFPYQGPMGLTSIYYHHILPQLGIAIDYLVEQAAHRSAGQIDFPTVRDDSYVQFRHHLPGHAPGRFFGLDEAWLWLPKGLVQPANQRLNWLSVLDASGTTLGISFANTASEAVTSAVQLNRDRLGGSGQALTLTHLVADGSIQGTEPLTGDAFSVTVPAAGLSAVLIAGMRVEEVLHTVPLTNFEDAAWQTLSDNHSRLGTVRAAIVGVSPEAANLYVFSTATPERLGSITVLVDGELRASCDRYPFEVSLPVTAEQVEVQVIATDRHGQQHTTESRVLRRPRPASEVQS